MNVHHHLPQHGVARVGRMKAVISRLRLYERTQYTLSKYTPKTKNARLPR